MVYQFGDTAQLIEVVLSEGADWTFSLDDDGGELEWPAGTTCHLKLFTKPSATVWEATVDVVERIASWSKTPEDTARAVIPSSTPVEIMLNIPNETKPDGFDHYKWFKGWVFRDELVAL